jgi:nucleoside phosphorylase
VQPLCDALKDAAADVRGSAATALGALGDRSAVQPLCDALKDDDPKTRGSAATALGALGDRSAVQPLCDALKDAAAAVRGSAATALGALGDRSAVQPLVALLADPSDQARLSAINSIGALADHLVSEDVISPLIDAAGHNSEPSVRTSAVMTLARHDRVTLPLVRYLLDPDFGRRDGRRRDTDWGVQGQTAAAVLRGYARSGPGDAALAIVARLLGEPETRNDVLRAALAPLADLPAPGLRRLLADVSARLPNPPDRVARLLEESRDKLKRYERAEQDFKELASSGAETLRAVFPPAPRPWFKKQEESRSVTRTAVLLTAAPIEAKSVYEDLGRRGIRLSQVPVAGRTLDQGNFTSAKGASWRLLLAQPVEKGPHSMQSIVKDVLAEVRPELLLMVGMCGGIEENGATENAVIAAKQVLNYEPQRLRPAGPSLTPSSYRCDPRIADCINAIARRGEIGAAVEEGDAPIELLLKAIGSGEKVIDDLNSPERANIVRLSGDLVGVETEGHGLYHPLWEDLLKGAPPPYALVKGVSDLVDGKMSENKLMRQKRATLRALTVAIAIIDSFA